MEHVRISPKGRALLNNRWLSSLVVKAISSDNEGLMYTKEGLKIYDENGKYLLTVQGATTKNPNFNENKSRKGILGFLKNKRC